MSVQLKEYKVFFASPAGLEAERRCFKDVIDEYNLCEAKARGAQFYPAEWDITLGGVKRPQEEINKLIKECDYFLLVLHDKWGSRPDKKGKGKFSSGTEEEFNLAMECYRDPKRHMKQVVPFFKAVEPERLADQGPQLKKVITFKKKMERSKEFYYQDFLNEQDFSEILRRHLAKWLQDHESGNADKVTPEMPPIQPAPAQTEPASDYYFLPEDTEMIKKANHLADEGKLVEAEECFARVVVKGNNPHAINEYGHFLSRTGRFSQAIVMYERVMDIGKTAKNEGWIASGYGDLGIIYGTRGDLDKAKVMFRKALEINERLGRHVGIANQYCNLGIIYWKRGSLDKAEAIYREALDIYNKMGHQEGMAGVYCNLGIIYRERGDLVRSEEMHWKGLEIEEKLGRQEGMAALYGNLGIVYKTRDKLDKAEEMLLKALKIHERLEQQEGLAQDYGNLGNIYYKRGEPGKAIEMYGKALELNTRLGLLEGMADQNGNLGIIYEKSGELDKAKEYWTKSLELYKKVGIPHMIEKVQGWLDTLGFR